MKSNIDPTKSKFEQEIDDLFLDGAIVVEVGEETKKLSVAEIYNTSFKQDRADIIKENLIQRCISNPQSAKRYLENARRVFEEGAKARTYNENVLAEGLRIRAQENQPYKFDFKAFIKQHENGAARSEMISGITGATEEQIQRIKEGRYNEPFNSLPDKSYRNNVFDSEVSARDDMEVNLARLDKFMQYGEDKLSQEEDKKCRKHVQKVHEAKNAMQYFGNMFLEGSKIVGRGIISKTEPSESKAYERYSQKRNQMLGSMLSSALPGRNRKEYIDMIKRRNSEIIGGDDVAAAAIAQQMNWDLDAILQKSDEEDQKRLKELEKKIEDGSKTTLDKLEPILEREDEAQKWQMMCAFMVLGPFVGGVALAPILGQVLGPVLAGSGSFAQNLAMLPVNPIFGPFADFAQLCHVPELIRYALENLPIISDFAEIMNFVTRNPISATIFESGLPLLDSPLVALGMAGMAIVVGTGMGTLIAIDKQTTIDARQTALEEVKQSFQKGEENLKKHRSEEIANATVRIIKETYPIAKFAEFLSSKTADDIDQLGMKFSPEDQKKFLELKNDVNNENCLLGDIRGFLQGVDFKGNADNKKTLDKFLLFKAVGEDPKKFQDAQKSPAEQEKLISKQRETFEQEAIERQAVVRGIIRDPSKSSAFTREENAKFLEQQILVDEKEIINRSVNLVKFVPEELPLPRPAKPKATAPFTKMRNLAL